MTDKTRTTKVGRREFMAGTAAGGLAVATGIIGMPHVARAANPVKIGIIHPVTGVVSYSGTQGRAGAMMAVEDINAAGGIKALGGAKLEALLADAQSKADIGAAEVEKLNEAGVAAVVGDTHGVMGSATMDHVRVAVTGVGEAPYRATAVEEALSGTACNAADVTSAASHATDGQTVNSDIHADAEYRAALAETLVRRAIEKARARTG